MAMFFLSFAGLTGDGYEEQFQVSTIGNWLVEGGAEGRDSLVSGDL